MEQENITLRKAQPKDAPVIHSIMQQVYDLLEDKTIYVCDDLEYIKKHLKENGFGVVAVNYKKEIIASLILRYPKVSGDNLGRDINLSDNELNRVVHMETAVVTPQYRGKGLQKLMIEYAEKLIDKNVYNILMSTVSPDNPASYKTFEKCGYTHILTKEKYGGLIRRIYLKRI